MDTVFVLHHLHVLPNGEDDIKFIGVYRSRESALEAIKRLRNEPGFKDHPRLVAPEVDGDGQGFHVGASPWTKITGRRATSPYDCEAQAMISNNRLESARVARPTRKSEAFLLAAQPER